MSYQGSRAFHLAIEVGDLERAVAFYCDVLGCQAGPGERGWRDIDFWGNELTLHAGGSPAGYSWHGVDMGSVPVPHYGVHLTREAYDEVLSRVNQAGLQFVVPPYQRFSGTEYQQETFFVQDPHGNCLEIKTLANPDL